MNKINIKPLSVNEAWKGRRYKTTAYNNYERSLLYLLPCSTIPLGALKIDIIYGFSNTGSDIDNPTKMLLDVMQKKYGFNDSRIYELNIKKEIVKKGDEFIKYSIESLII